MRNRLKNIMIIGTSAILFTGFFNSIQAGSIDTNINHINITDTEQQATQSSKIQIYNVTNEKEHDSLLNALENRNGKILIEVTQGTVLNEYGDGVDICNYYIHYDINRFSKGDKVQSVFIYDPNNNYIDGILYRIDTLIV